MGVLDGFHAVTRPGHAFIFFHSIAGLAGGIGAALIWSPGFARMAKRIGRWTMRAIAGGLFVLGIFIILSQRSLPAMSRDDVFTPAAIWINLVSGLAFLIVTAYFVADFIKSKRIESFLFSCLYMLSLSPSPFSAA
jgi:hypothetical protein